MNDDDNKQIVPLAPLIEVEIMPKLGPYDDCITERELHEVQKRMMHGANYGMKQEYMTKAYNLINKGKIKLSNAWRFME